MPPLTCRKPFALPYLPTSVIPTAFAELTRKSRLLTNNGLAELCDNVDRMWINDDMWAPTTWSVYRQDIRTNTDVEGWHRRLNFKSQRSSLPFYALLSLLSKEAQAIRLQAHLQDGGAFATPPKTV